MKPITHYTTVTDYTEKKLQRLDRGEKLLTMSLLTSFITVSYGAEQVSLTNRTLEEIKNLSLNESLGLIKALADQCQETLISK